MSGSYNILNRILAENTGSAAFFFNGDTGNTIQNSVVRNTAKRPGYDNECVVIGLSANLRVINNDLYGCTDGTQAGDGSLGVGGLVIENNDYWVPSDYYSGSRSCVENAVDLKAGGTASNPVRVIHNRAWGFRPTDTACGGSGDAGGAMIVHCPSCNSGSNFVLFQDNIIVDSTGGIWTPNPQPSNISYIGNLLYQTSYALETTKADKSEIYLNTVISTSRYLGAGTNADVRCNVNIDGGSNAGYGYSGSQIDYNAYYGTVDSGEANQIPLTLRTRSSSTSYSVGDIVRIGSPGACASPTDVECFLFRVEQGGTTDVTQPAYCTSLGCTLVDGNVWLRAIRGPYAFYRKLRTAPELYVVPYARLYGGPNIASGAPEANACPADFAARSGVGFN
jgi:hypothetical protein